METRNRRDRFVQKISLEIFAIAHEIGSIESGWSTDKKCRLTDSEKLWLDPGRADQDSRFAQARSSAPWRANIAKSFAGWIQQGLGQELPLSDIEHVFFAEVFEEELVSQNLTPALVH
jgi:CRISPR-associated protein Csy1